MPSDHWLRVKTGEVVIGLFEGPKGSDVIALASHNAYAPQTVTLEFAAPVKVRLFDRSRKRWAPSRSVRGEVTFQVQECATELIRIER